MDVQVDTSYESKYARMYFDAEARKADRPQTKIMELCAQTQLSCINILPEFRNHPQKDQLYFAHNADPHFSPLGHQVYADFLKRIINQ